MESENTHLPDISLGTRIDKSSFWESRIGKIFYKMQKNNILGKSIASGRLEKNRHLYP
jgi:hypothetical protein